MWYTLFDFDTLAVVRLFRADNNEQIAVQSSKSHEFIYEGFYPDHLYMWGLDEAEPVLRPKVLDFTKKTLAIGEILDLVLPIGTKVVYEILEAPLNRLGRRPREATILEDGKISIQSTKQDTFTFIFEPPFPYVQQHEIKVVFSV